MIILAKAYEGNEKYIFFSYAHRDSATVLPMIEYMQENGFRIWYDAGIEAGTEWPEYIEERLKNANKVVVCMSQAAINSRNCRNEINYALQLGKELLVVYLENVELAKGMNLQLNSVQSLFRTNHSTFESFLEALGGARLLQTCRAEGEVSYERPAVIKNFSDTRIRNVLAIGSNDPDDVWPKGSYSDTINRDEHSVVFFHIWLDKPLGFSGEIKNQYRIFNSNNNQIFIHEPVISVEADYDRISTGWIIKGRDGSFIPSGEYRFECVVNGSPTFTYNFHITDNSEIAPKKKSFFKKLFG